MRTSRRDPPPAHPWHGSPLCPTSAICNVFQFTAPVSLREFQVFNWVDGANVLNAFSYGAFVSKLLGHLSILGLDPRLYAGHSFRRGGASFAYQSGVPIELIKALGDWRSDTILIYLTMPLTIHLHSANMLCKAILHTYVTPSSIIHFSTPCHWVWVFSIIYYCCYLGSRSIVCVGLISINCLNPTSS